ncbi:hypothetical protein ACLOJK_009982 [Asimina triloba]
MKGFVAVIGGGTTSKIPDKVCLDGFPSAWVGPTPPNFPARLSPFDRYGVPGRRRDFFQRTVPCVFAARLRRQALEFDSARIPTSDMSN